MEETLFIFDDWAMHVMKKWIEVHRKYNAFVDGREQSRINFPSTIYNQARLKSDVDQAYFDLTSYLFSLLDYDVPRHRYGYPSYIILSEDCVKTLKRYRSMIIASQPRSIQQHMLEANIERTLRECLAREGSAFFDQTMSS